MTFVPLSPYEWADRIQAVVEREMGDAAEHLELEKLVLELREEARKVYEIHPVQE